MLIDAFMTIRTRSAINFI